MADLSTVPPARLSAVGDAIAGRMAESADRWGQAAHRSILFSPVVGDDALPVTPWRALADGAGRNVGLLVGHTRDEHRLFSALDGRLGAVTEAQAETALSVLAPGVDGARRYRAGFPTAGPEELYEVVNSDWAFRMPTLYLAEAQVAGGGRSYVYELTWSAPGMGGILGACHGLDVPLVFGNLDRGQPAMLIGEQSNAEAETLSASMRAAWTAFATHGDPGWPAYEPSERLVQVFDTRPTVVADPERASRLIWGQHAFPVLSLTSPSR
jgi:para-nitrobenzyl esterase